MKAIIEYQDISSLTLEKVLERIQEATKLLIENASISDFALTEAFGEIKFHEFNYRNYFGYGVYVLFENKRPVYVGMTADNFFHRLLSHCNTELQPFWGWNALLKKIASKSNSNKNHNELTSDELIAAVEVLKTYELIRINVLKENWDKKNCKKLEKLLMRGFKFKGYDLLNTRFGSISEGDIKRNLTSLING